MLKIGIVGLPNAGKSTLFNTLGTEAKAQTAPYPFTTINNNEGVVTVPDKTLFLLAKIENIAKVTPATIEFVDIAGLIKGAHQGEGLGNQFLHHIREVDLILHVVRFFKNTSIPHVHLQIDPKEDLEIINEELIFADIELLRRKSDSPKTTAEEKELIKKLMDNLNKEVPVNKMELTDKEKEQAQSFNLLTFKRQILVANIDEDNLKNPPKTLNNQPILAVCAKLEEDLADLPWVEQQQFLKEYGLKESAKEKIILACYQALDIITFYTIAKRQEAKAWVMKKGATALTAAGKIHTDFAKNFVKIEQINIDDLIKIGGWHKAHEQGRILTHGKDYLVKDRDVLEFKVAVK